MYDVKTPVQEMTRALLIVMERGSLRDAERITGHTYETFGQWLRLAATHAEAISDVLANDLHLEAVEIDAFWSFVQKNEHDAVPNAGERRGCLVQFPASRFIVAHAHGRIGDDLMDQAVGMAVARTGRRSMGVAMAGDRVTTRL